MNLIRRKRGISGIISGVFLVIVAMLAFSTLYWQYVQQDHYTRVVLSRMQREWERINERMTISETGYGSFLRFKIRNTGGVTAHIVTVYLNDTTTSVFKDLILANYICSNSSAYISPSTERWIYTSILVTADHVYDLKVATERGNLGVSERFNPSYVLRPGEAQPMPFVFGFGYSDFQYKKSGVWYPAWKMTTQSVEAVRIFLNNTYPKAVYVNPTKQGGEYLTRMRYVPENFASSGMKYAAYDQTKTTMISAESGDWIYFGAIDLSGGVDRWYVFIEIFYYFSDAPTEIYGSSVAILAVYTQ